MVPVTNMRYGRNFMISNVEYQMSSIKKSSIKKSSIETRVSKCRVSKLEYRNVEYRNVEYRKVEIRKSRINKVSDATYISDVVLKDEHSATKRIIFTYPMVAYTDMEESLKTDVLEICTNACEKYINDNQSVSSNNIIYEPLHMLAFGH